MVKYKTVSMDELKISCVLPTKKAFQKINFERLFDLFIQKKFQN